MRKALELLATMHERDIEWFIDQGAPKHIRRGVTLIEQGVSVNFVYIILEGAFAVAIATPARKVIANLFSGDIVGEMSFISSRAPSASVAATEDSHVLEIPHTVLRNRLSGDPEFAARFYKALACFLASRLERTVEHLGYGDLLQDNPADELDDTALEDVSRAAMHFDSMLKRVRAN